MALTEREMWAVAIKVLRDEEDSGAFLIERIKSLMDAGDEEGLETWLAVANRVQRLIDRPADPEDLN